VPSPAPAPPATAATQEREATRQTSGNVTWSENGEKLSINYRGAFTLNDTDTDIARVSPGGYLKISEGGWLRGRSLELTADDSGNITRRFRVGNDERPYEPEGRLWLAQVLPRFVRQTGFAAKERVARLLAKGGVPAVLEEISLIKGDYGRKVYFLQLLMQAPLDAAAARRVLEQAGREIDSDYELATTLIAAAEKLLIDDATRKAYFDAARNIESDYEMRRVYSAALKRGTITPGLMAGVLEASRDLGSDYEAASLLLEIVQQHAIEGAVRQPFFSALETIESSYEKGRVLQALLRRSDLSADTLLGAVTAAGTVGGDYETAQVLLAASRSHTISGATREAYIRAAERLGDYERSRTLAALVRAEKR
ncbi:MAG TPA: hypothetical protein VJ813_18500, partial [Vicinamibacterales bacterium]|nr:hypothetical protein [Vicinamibacterales bacterium]